MDDVWDCRDQAENERAKIEPRPASSPNTKSDEGGDRNTGNAVTVKILRPNIVVTQQIKLEKGWQRPNDDRGEKARYPREMLPAPDRGSGEVMADKNFTDLNFAGLLAVDRAKR